MCIYMLSDYAITAIGLILLDNGKYAHVYVMCANLYNLQISLKANLLYYACYENMHKPNILMCTYLPDDKLHSGLYDVIF